MDRILEGQNLERARSLLCELQDVVQAEVISLRSKMPSVEMAAVAAETSADTIYKIDECVEHSILQWFDTRWPIEWPTLLVMEGLEGRGELLLNAPAGEPRLTCIIDPIDGTRGFMHDKRSAWVLAALAEPPDGRAAYTDDVVVAAMTELPVSKQWRADQISGIKGCGIIARGRNIIDPSHPLLPLTINPSNSRDFRHGFASLARFFPEGASIAAQVEEELWDELIGIGKTSSPTIFQDQYISTGGQLYEVMSGRDRMVADLRPFFLRELGLHDVLVCHPYDICTEMLAREAGCIVEHPLNGTISVPLDTTAPVSWVAYANEQLAEQVRPVLRRILGRFG